MMLFTQRRKKNRVSLQRGKGNIQTPLAEEKLMGFQIMEIRDAAGKAAEPSQSKVITTDKPSVKIRLHF